MNYLKALSPKGILIGLLAGYVIPFSVVKGIVWVAFSSGIESVFLSPTSGLLVTVVVLIACPFFGGYLAAKNSGELPVVNAVVTTIIGITLISSVVGIYSMVVHSIGATVALVFGYFGGGRVNVSN